MPYVIEDPRFMPGHISGQGMEHTPNGRIVDTRHAVMLDFIDACLIEHPRPGQPMYAVALAGAINGATDERARCLFLFNAEGAGILINRIIDLAGMISPDFPRQLLERVERLRPAEPVAEPGLEPEMVLEPDLEAPDPMATQPVMPIRGAHTDQRVA